MKHDEMQAPELGLRPIRLRTRTAKVEEALRRRHLGLGSLFFSGEQALHAMQQMELEIDMLMLDDNLDGKHVVELRRLQVDFNSQIIAVGKAYLASARDLEHQAQTHTADNLQAIPRR